MVKSMTGYGRARQELHKRDITVEVRSVNNRYLDCTVKMPRMYAFAEDAVKKHVQQAVSRGKVDVRQVVGSDYSAWKEGGLLFNNDSFEDILKTLERVYNVKVHLRTSAYHSNRLTIHFNKNESLVNIMMLLKEIVPGLEYQIKEDGVYID